MFKILFWKKFDLQYLQISKSKSICLLLQLFAIFVLIVYNCRPQRILNDKVNPITEHKRTNAREHIRYCIKRQEKNCCKFVPKTTTIPYQLLTSQTDGRLGNQMFSYAALYAVSKYNNRTAQISPSMSNYFRNCFKISTMSAMDELLYYCIPWIDHELPYNPDISKEKNITEKYIKLIGYPESWKFFEEFKPQILKEFEFEDSLQEKAKEEISKILEGKNSTTVGTHVRRGDYIRYSNSSNIQLPDFTFYSGAMEYFTKRFGQNVIFIVASDDIPWCKKDFAPIINLTNYNVKFLSNESRPAGLDMAILSHCDHVIFGVGSFGFWAGYLSKGEVAFCSDCLSSKSRVMRILKDYGNFVLPSWKGFARNGTFSSVLPAYGKS